jgi:hypothetical protein
LLEMLVLMVRMEEPAWVVLVEEQEEQEALV